MHNSIISASVLAAALLASCGGSQPPISAPGTIPQTRAVATYAERSDPGCCRKQRVENSFTPRSDVKAFVFSRCLAGRTLGPSTTRKPMLTWVFVPIQSGMSLLPASTKLRGIIPGRAVQSFWSTLTVRQLRLLCCRFPEYSPARVRSTQQRGTSLSFLAIRPHGAAEWRCSPTLRVRRLFMETPNSTFCNVVTTGQVIFLLAEIP